MTDPIRWGDILPSPMELETKVIAGQLNDMLGKHEVEDHDGDPCPEERANVLAYIAHCIGVRDQNTVKIFIQRLAHYEEEHYRKHEHNGHEEE